MEELKDKDRGRKGKKVPEAQKVGGTHSPLLRKEMAGAGEGRKEHGTSVSGDTRLRVFLQLVRTPLPTPPPRKRNVAGVLLGPKFLNISFFRQHTVLLILWSWGLASGMSVLCITESLLSKSHKLELWYLLILNRLEFAGSTLWSLNFLLSTVLVISVAATWY